MPSHVTSHDIALIFMIAGVLSLVLHEPLAKLDTLLSKGGPTLMAQRRHDIAQWCVIGAGVLLVALSLALVVR